MPYGLFDYGGTINTMGESPTYEQMGYNANGLPFPVLGTGTQADPFRPDTSYKFPTNTGTDGNLMVTKAIPEDGPIDYRPGQLVPDSYVTRAINEEAIQITTAALYEEGNPYTDKAPEDGPGQQLTTMMVGEEEPNYNPTTLRMPEDGQFPNPPTGGTGGCPAGYAPSGGGGGGGGGGLPDWGAQQRSEILGFHSNPYGLLAGEYLTGAGSGDPFNIHGAGTTWIQTNK